MTASSPTSEQLEPIQMLWIRGDFSRLEQLSVRSFVALGHPVHLYTYAPGRNWPKDVKVFDAAEIVPERLAPLAPAAPFGRGSMGAFSDYFRYRLLLERGGWWCDCDIVATRPWRFNAIEVVASTEEQGHGRTANSCAMRFPAGHRLMQACVTAVDRLDLKGVGFGQTGPLLLNQCLHEQELERALVSPSVFNPVPWNASWQLIRPLWRRWSIEELKQRIRRPHLSMRFTPETVAVHLWNETWRHEGRDKNKRYPQSCLYERLQRRFVPSTT